jgi:hypothetical protein
MRGMFPFSLFLSISTTLCLFLPTPQPSFMFPVQLLGHWISSKPKQNKISATFQLIRSNCLPMDWNDTRKNTKVKIALKWCLQYL